MSEEDIQYDEVMAFAEFPRECELVLVAAGWAGYSCSSETVTKVELICAALQWLARHKRNKLVRVEADVLRSLLEEVQAEFNRQTGEQAAVIKPASDDDTPACDGYGGGIHIGERRRLELGGGAAAILCKRCFDREMWWREQRNRHLQNFKYVTKPDPIPRWEDLPIVTDTAAGAQQPAVKVSASLRACLLTAAYGFLTVTGERGHRLETAETSALPPHAAAELQARHDLDAAAFVSSVEATVSPETDAQLVAAGRHLLKVTGKRGAELVRKKKASVLGSADATELQARGSLAEVLVLIPED